MSERWEIPEVVKGVGGGDVGGGGRWQRAWQNQAKPNAMC